MTDAGRILLLGVGGAGAHSVDRSAATWPSGVDVAAIDTDASTLALCAAPRLLQIGVSQRGLGGSGNPEVGRRSAEESRAEIRLLVAGAAVTVMAAGLGGGTGTGASTIVASEVAESGGIVIACVSMPFTFEGRRRQLQAVEGLEALQASAHFVLSVANDSLLQIVENRSSMQEAFQMADRVPGAVCDALARLVGPHSFETIAAGLAAVSAEPRLPVQVFRNERLTALPSSAPTGLSPTLGENSVLPRTGLEPTQA